MNTEFQFTDDEINDITEHMNSDHADALLLYAQAYCQLEESALNHVQMTTIDATGIDLSVESNGQKKIYRVNFSETGVTEKLSSRADARPPLVNMVRIARARVLPQE